MRKEEIIEKIYQSGIVPVIAVNELDQALPLAKAVIESGLNALEITFRTECAAEALKTIRKEYPRLLLGAGTILSRQQADEAMKIGADFLVTPGFNKEIVEYVAGKGFPIVPGVSTASEIDQAVTMGLDLLKFFPAEPSGGTAALKLFAGPYKKMRFIPTGGITFDNFTSYTALDNVLAVGGSFMIDKKHIAEKDVDAMKSDIGKVVDKLLDLKLCHIGINCENEDEAMSMAKLLEQFLHMSYKAGNSSIFCGEKEFELMKKKGRGRNGHIAIGTSNIDRAMNYLSYRGVAFDQDSLVIKENRKTAIYFADEIGGFAFHLMRR